MVDIESLLRHPTGAMRTTPEIAEVDPDSARARAAARMPVKEWNGFPVFQVPAGTPSFGPDDVAAAMEREDQAAGREFLEPGR